MGHGGEVWRASPDRHWTGRESEERAARADDWPKEAEAGYRGQPCKNSSTLNKKTDDKKISVEVDDKIITSNMIKDTNIFKAREGRRQETEKRDLEKEVESLIVVKAPPIEE